MKNEKCRQNQPHTLYLHVKYFQLRRNEDKNNKLFRFIIFELRKQEDIFLLKGLSDIPPPPPAFSAERP